MRRIILVEGYFAGCKIELLPHDIFAIVDGNENYFVLAVGKDALRTAMTEVKVLVRMIMM